MKRIIFALAGVVLLVTSCSDGGDGTSSSAAADDDRIHKPEDQVTVDDGVKFHLTGWGTFRPADSNADYTVLYAEAENTGEDTAQWDPMATFTPEGERSVDYTVLDMRSGVDGVFRSGAHAELSWGFAMPPEALKSGTFTLFGSENWFGDFTTLPDLTPEVPELRETVEAFMAEGRAIEAAAATGETVDYMEMIRKYATSECAAVFEGLYAAFGDAEPEDAGAVELLSVTDDGAEGTSVTRGRSGVDETQHWILQDGAWKFTCEGMFEADSDADPEVVEPEVVEPEATAGKGTSCSDNGATANNNNLICIHGTWVGVAYPNGDPGDPCPMVNTDGLDTDGNLGLCKRGVWS